MRRMTTISTITPMIAGSHGVGWAVEHGDDPVLGVKQLIQNPTREPIPPGTDCVAEQTGVNLVIVQADAIPQS